MSLSAEFRRHYDFSRPLDDLWEAIPEKDWSFSMAPGAARLANGGSGRAEIFLRPCCGYGDRIEFRFADGTRRAGRFQCGFVVGFEFITLSLDWEGGRITARTHEFHKAQPRACGVVLGKDLRALELIHERDDLPGLPYAGSRLRVFGDGRPLLEVREVDFLPESLFAFGLDGPGEITLASFSIEGPARPRPEHVRVGAWTQGIKPTTAENVNGLLEGVRRAAAAGVQILITPETSLTGLRPTDPELADAERIQSELRRFQNEIARIPNAPYTLIGYPEWVNGREVESATLPAVKINAHRFVCPDGGLGPRMAKVHSCEEGFWHGRRYNLQRVAGVEVALGVCHDIRYPDVWTVGVMGGARLCLHPAAGGPLKGSIPVLRESYRSLGTALDAFWVHANAGGGAAVVYPTPNRKQPDTLLAVSADLTEASPTYPEYSPQGDHLAHARIRLWDATGCYPLRTLRAGAATWGVWSSLIPPLEDVDRI